MEIELDLISDCKESKGHNIVVAKVSVCSLSSQPVDHEENNKSTGNEIIFFELIFNFFFFRSNARIIFVNSLNTGNFKYYLVKVLKLDL